MSVVNYRRRWLLVTAFLISLFCLSSGDELQTLMRLKTALLLRSNTSVFGSWNEDNPVCNFTGIHCNSENLVIEIDLSERNLSGVVPFDAICSLQSLEKLSLSSNSLQGTIAEDLRNCTRLKHLDLGFNSFTGEVPDLSSLSGLEFLNLNASGFSGSFPWKSLENLTNLAFLSLGDNPFDSSLFPTEVLKLEKLYWLYLTNCSLTGKFPEDIGNLTLLENLELSDNRLTGEIPPSIVKLKNLRQLELYNNSFTGKLPKGLGNLTSLVNFDASQNLLQGDLSELRFLTKLESLQLFENRFVGEIPDEIGQFENLLELSLYRNSLTGKIPQRLGSWKGMEYIDLS